MSRKGPEYRKKRELKKLERRKREEMKTGARAKPKLSKVLTDLKEIFHHDTDGLSDEQIAQQLAVTPDRVQRLLDLVADLPPGISAILQAHPEVLSNSDALSTIINAVSHPRS